MKNQQNKGRNCSVNGCGRNARCKGLCFRHYQQIRLRGNIKSINPMFINGMCNILGCGKKAHAKGMCQAHYKQKRIEAVKQGTI